ncbi:atherin-like [Hyaena hyaena]|uniref:atherin-like n=1 Tax=Hyaena hyaena TaxID=95912 RepID=UPI001920F352|nr:atherin-like [Hyaena hyaena]
MVNRRGAPPPAVPARVPGSPAWRALAARAQTSWAGRGLPGSRLPARRSWPRPAPPREHLAAPRPGSTWPRPAPGAPGRAPPREPGAGVAAAPGRVGRAPVLPDPESHREPGAGVGEPTQRVRPEAPERSPTPARPCGSGPATWPLRAAAPRPQVKEEAKVSPPGGRGERSREGEGRLRTPARPLRVLCAL